MSHSLEAAIVICAILFSTNISNTHGIFNGRDPKLNEVKYMVTMIGEVLGSGGIISDKHILTAAHCITPDGNNKMKPIKVIAVTNSSYEYDPKVSIVRDVKRAFILSKYNQNTYYSYNDIAVLELSESLQIEKNSDSLQKLEFPTPSEADFYDYPCYVGKKYLAAGFGSTVVEFVPHENNKTKPKTSGGGRLQVANAIVLEKENCITPIRENRSSMCTTVIEDPQRKTFQGYCAGDSGAPIVVDDKIVIGVITSGGGCNNNVNPANAVKTTVFRPFIQNAMNGYITSYMRVYNAL